jgi:hypothetical protein
MVTDRWALQVIQIFELGLSFVTQITFKEFLFAFMEWVGVEDDAEDEESADELPLSGPSAASLPPAPASATAGTGIKPILTTSKAIIAPPPPDEKGPATEVSSVVVQPAGTPG